MNRELLAHRLRRSKQLLRSNPRLFLSRAREWAGTRRSLPAAPTGPAPTTISRTQEEVASDLIRRSVRRVAAYGNRAFAEEMTGILPAASVTWVSHDADDLREGAAMLRDVLREGCECVVVGGPEVKLAYVNTLRHLVGVERLPIVRWVGGGWEWCGSQIPVPREASGADLYLFHHFEDYFQVKDPLLVHVTASDGVSDHESWVVMQPRQTVRWSLSDLLPNRDGPAVVDVRTEHPVLMKGRHQRWRLCADVKWEDSFATLHGGHDFCPLRQVQARRPLSDLQGGHVALVIPNDRLDSTDPAVAVQVGAGRSSLQRRLDRRVAELELRATADESAEDNPAIYGYDFIGAGTPFWFGFSDAASRKTLFANHEVSVRIREEETGLAGSVRRRLEGLVEHGFRLHPHPLPLLGPDDEIEFGFDFGAANPSIRRFTARLYDQKGQMVDDLRVEQTEPGPLFPDGLPTAIDRTKPGLLVLSPDWESMNADPALLNAVGDLVARSRVTSDFDVTEFQSCWRNLGAKVDGFPHWIVPDNAVAGRTNVLARLRSDDVARTAVVAVNASGFVDYDTTARVRLTAVSPDGRSRTAEKELRPFCASVFWLDEELASLSELLPGGFGTVHVTSPDADLNCQIVTVSTAGAVSLQHMWGY